MADFNPEDILSGTVIGIKADTRINDLTSSQISQLIAAEEARDNPRSGVLSFLADAQSEAEEEADPETEGGVGTGSEADPTDAFDANSDEDDETEAADNDISEADDQDEFEEAVEVEEAPVVNATATGAAPSGFTADPDSRPATDDSAGDRFTGIGTVTPQDVALVESRLTSVARAARTDEGISNGIMEVLRTYSKSGAIPEADGNGNVAVSLMHNLHDDLGVAFSDMTMVATDLNRYFDIHITNSEAENFLLVRDVVNMTFRKLNL